MIRAACASDTLPYGEQIMAQLGDHAPLSIPPTALLQIGRMVVSATEPSEPSDTPSPWLPGQGQTNACGTTTLAYILRYFMGAGAPPREAIDRAIRRGNIFSAPGLLASFAREQGLAAELYDSLPMHVLFELVDRSIPVMVLLDTTPLNLVDTANLHWVAVIGHDDRNVAIYNPHGFQEQLDIDSFRSHWSQARLFGLPAWRSLAIPIAPYGTRLPSGRRRAISAIGANLAAGGLARVLNAGAAIRTTARPKGILTTLRTLSAETGRMTIGVGQVTIGSVTLLLSALARRLKR
jgi:hypothetical protein